MGLALKDIITRQQIEIDALRGKILCVDAYNMLYQFLTTIRMADGTPLKDSNGLITSHLSGLFNRTMSLMQKDVKLAFVFDGKPPLLKRKERERRAVAKGEALNNFRIAEQRKDIIEMKKYASRTAVLTRDLIDEAIDLIKAMGSPITMAPSEGEAQAAYMVNKGDAYAVVSQDFDSLLYNAKKIVRNLSITGKRKVPNKPVFETVQPELIETPIVLKELGITQEQLIILAILVGTDYNYGGIKGIGPQKALKLVRQYDDYDKMFSELKWSFDFSWKEVYDVITNMPVTDDYSLKFTGVDREKVIDILCKKHAFSRERVESQLGRTVKSGQKGLGEFF